MEDNQKPNNPQAFPYTEECIIKEADESFPPIYKYIQKEGMTLRDYFAAKAMAALLTGMGVYSSSDIASSAYVVADKMLKERSKDENS